jgi:hypothetical protein
MADMPLIRRVKLDPLPWGRANLSCVGAAHDAYIAAMRQADAGDFRSLMRFAAG